MAAESLFEGFEEHRRDSPDAPAILDFEGGQAFSRDGLLTLADELAPALRRAASASGVVAVQIPNGPELVAAVLCAWREGLVPLLIDRDRSVDEIDTLARALGTSIVLRGEALGIHWVEHVGEAVALSRDTAVLKLTSGSTGEPRAVAVGASALRVGIEQICSTMGIGPADRNLVTLPLAHSYAFDNVIGTLVVHGTPLVLVSDLVPRHLFAVLRETGVTVWPTVPLLLDVMARSGAAGEAPLGSLRSVISAGAPLPAATRERFAQRFHLRPRTFYGATECGGISFDREGTGDLPDGCVGHPMDGVSIALVDAEDGVGRIRVESASVASGTYPEATPGLGERTLLTSDLGRVDPQGRLHLLGRVGEFVKIHGHKVYPVEVERVIRGIDGVWDVTVVPHARSDVSEGLRAVIAADPGVDRAAIVRGCEERLSSHKVPRSIEIRRELPRNERGKLDRLRL